MPEELVRDFLVSFFLKWGKVKAVRVDNGEPFGSPEPSTVTALALWLMSYGVKVIWNEPGCPQQNGKVERMQDVSFRWSEAPRAACLEQAQAQLDEAALIQREEYPVTRLNNQTRLQAFPELLCPLCHWDEADFVPMRAYEFLSKKVYPRKVSSNGQITHLNRKIRVGASLKAQFLTLRLDAQKIEWCIYTAGGTLVKSSPAPYLEESHLKNLSVYSKNL